ncbi:MAG TPA: hypothetical protein VF759_11075 [Allosphingosinicella sp.]
MIDEAIGIAGVTVRRAARLPALLEGAVRVGPYSTARPGALLRVVPGVGRFLAQGGDRLEYWLEPGADEGAAEALLKGGVLGALIHQRGELPLHASTLVSPDGEMAVAIAGHSGAGKSTTAYALALRGWALLGEDLTRVTIEEGKPLAWPGRGRLRLLDDACASFGLDPASLAQAPNGQGKYLLEPERRDRPAPLGAVVVLDRSPAEPRLDPVGGAAAVGLIAEHTYRPHYVSALGQGRRHFQLVAAVAAGARVLHSRGRASVGEVADALLSSLKPST